MLASEIIQDVRRELLETTAAFWSDAELLRHLNRGQIDYINRTRSLEDTASLTTTIGTMDYQLPQNWTSAKAVFYNTKEDPTDNDAWKRLDPSSLEKMAQERPNFMASETIAELQATPEVYFIWEKRIYLYPSPRNSNDGDLFLWYKAKPIPVLTLGQSIELDESLAEALTAYILWKAWTKAKETALAAAQRQIYAEYIGEGRRWIKRRSGDQRYKVDIISAQRFGDSHPFGSSIF